MANEADIEKIEAPLAIRVASLSKGTQRWLKTALQAVTSVEPEPALEEEEPVAEAKAATKPRPRPATLEDVVTGKADLREHLEAYPELAEELDGLADVIDLLRESGERRRKRGEQILREEILGEKAEGEEGEERE